MQELAIEDPLLDVIWRKEERELLLSITGLIQLEVLQEQLSTRYGLQVQFGAPSIIYKETLAGEGIGYISPIRVLGPAGRS